MTRKWQWWWALGVCLFLASPAAAQSIGGNASIAVTSTTGNVQMPADLQKYPFALLEYGVGASSQEVFYKLGVDNTVAAVATSGATQSPALPAAGICVVLGPNGWIAAITATSTATLRITQLSVCPPR
jgi:hypothetical protein